MAGSAQGSREVTIQHVHHFNPIHARKAQVLAGTRVSFADQRAPGTATWLPHAWLTRVRGVDVALVS